MSTRTYVLDPVEDGPENLFLMIGQNLIRTK